MVSLYRDPEGENVFSKSTPGSTSSPQITTNASGKGQKLENNNWKIESLQDQVKELQFALSKYESDNSEQLERRPSKVTFSEFEVEPKQHHSPSNGVATSNGAGSEMNSTAFWQGLWNIMRMF